MPGPVHALEVNNTMRLRQEFVWLATARTLPFIDLRRRFNISRQTDCRQIKHRHTQGEMVRLPA
jgi:hypothetical protein